MIAPKKIADLPVKLKTVTVEIDRMFEEIYLVGGAVRDSILGRDTLDLDFAVPYPPEQVSRILKENKLPVYETGIRFNTVGSIVKGYSIQITSYRSERYEPDSRHPEIERVRDIYGDIDRRDFTINAFALSRDEFIDTHNGLDDLDGKRIRSVLSPEQKFTEDPVRILRAYRLVAMYGFNIEKNTHTAMLKLKQGIQNLPGERIGEELRKLSLGKYWSDALFEMTEDGVFNSILEQLGISIKVISDNVFSVLDNYSANALESMSELDRWIRIMEIIHDAEKNSGATTIDIMATADHLCSSAALPRDLRIAIKKHFSETTNNTAATIEPVHTPSSSEKVTRRYEQVNEQKLKGKRAYYDTREYGIALKAFEKSLSILDKLYDSAIKDIHDSSLRSEKLKRLSRTYIDHMGFKIASYVMANRLYARYSNTSGLERKILHDIHSGRLNKKDQQQALHEALVRVYRSSPFDSNLETFDVFIERIKNHITDEKYSYYLRNYLNYQLKNTNLPKEKARLNRKLASAIANQSDDTRRGLDYYDACIDHLYYSALSAESLESFQKKFTLLNDELPQYMAVANAEGKKWYALKRASLNSASCNIHAFNLSRSVQEKYVYVSDAIDDYEDAGPAYRRNADRYRIHKDWLDFVKWIQGKSSQELKIKDVQQRISKLSSLGYIDSDEAYFSSKMLDTAHIRNLLGEMYTFSTFFDKESNPIKLKDRALNSIHTLYMEGVINERNALIAFKNYLQLQSKVAIEDTDSQITDISKATMETSEIDQLLANLEDKNTEFKASWKYDVKKSSEKQAVANNDIKFKIMHTITAFMNTFGGTILIGVTDNREICGINETDARLFLKVQNIGGVVDKIRLEIDEIFEKQIGKEFQNFKEVLAKQYKGKTVLMIKVRRFDGEQLVPFDSDIYVRGEAGTRALTVKEARYYRRAETPKNNVATR